MGPASKLALTFGAAATAVFGTRATQTAVRTMTASTSSSVRLMVARSAKTLSQR